ncbi:hypothetical protein BT63DRAFT_437782 [Microthyrium microscopicum]|uniref:Integral membrane protein n=1 Tax=Microthyrium microscopicum TaxID=703497 RepID=A0A6A6UJG6_9PEZI|nr:hypothetical protein BT63DRAFT_437782 [Microthyrium microscopicum]
MDPQRPSRPPLQARQETTHNPVIALGRKVKSVLSTSQRPSIRILRDNTPVVPVADKIAEKFGSHQDAPGNAPDIQITEPVEHHPLPTAAHPGPTESYPNAPIHPEIASAHPQEPLHLQPEPTREDAPSLHSTRSRPSGVRRLFSRTEKAPSDHASPDDEYDADMVDLLDVVDPEVSTLSTLTNVQNSLFVPSLGRLVNRQPTYRLKDSPGEQRTVDRLRESMRKLAHPTDQQDDHLDTIPEGGRPELDRSHTIASDLTETPGQFAILPEGETLEGWTHAEKAELNDIVRHMLHSRRSKMKRTMKGFGQYVRRPFGLFITVYATLITLFGAAWVFFLIGWVSLGSKKDYIVNVVDNVLVALFAIIGDGLAPFRAVDTYHMIYIVHYHRKTWKKRAKMGLPELADHNDLPDQRKEDVEAPQIDLESLVARRMPNGLAKRIAPMIPRRIARGMVNRSGANDQPAFEYTVLTPEQQAKLEFHERKFAKSHTFYKPHETQTHYAFPLKLLMTVVILLDLHSCLQISLGACTWGIPYKERPFALTTVILCCSITCNILGGVFISVGDKRTRKKDVIERMMRQELTAEAIEQMEKRRLKELEERGEIDRSVRKQYEHEKEEQDNKEVKHAWKTVPLLPKKLLGKGEDHRQPSLPQRMRKSGSVAGSSAASTTSGSSGNSGKVKSKKNTNAPLASVEEGTTAPQYVSDRPGPALAPPLEPIETRGPEPVPESRRDRVMKFIRRADFDRS